MLLFVYLRESWGDGLDIEYKNKGLKTVCTNASAAKKKHGWRMAEIIHRRIDQINSADSVDLMVQYKIGRCHQLSGDRQGQYAVDLIHPYRLVFEVRCNEKTFAFIIGVFDYH